MNRFLAGVGKALIFKGDNLIAVAQTLTESTFDFSITGEEIRGGAGNALWGKYFHDSNLNVTLTDAMFNLDYIAASLGVDVDGTTGGLDVMEEGLTVAGDTVTLSELPTRFDGTAIVWYKKPSDEVWNMTTIISGKEATLDGFATGDTACVKYQYINPNARYIKIPVNYVPAELHVVIINDLFNGDISTNPAETTKIGKLITDIPRLQMDGNQNLSLTASGAATTSLSGSALAVSNVVGCDDEPYYGTMTEEISGRNWKDDVIAIAVANSDIEMVVGESEALDIYVVPKTGAAQKHTAADFTITVDEGGTFVSVVDGVVTADGVGNAVISVKLTDSAVAPAIVRVEVTA